MVNIQGVTKKKLLVRILYYSKLYYAYITTSRHSFDCFMLYKSQKRHIHAHSYAIYECHSPLVVR